MSHSQHKMYLTVMCYQFRSFVRKLARRYAQKSQVRVNSKGGKIKNGLLHSTLSKRRGQSRCRSHSIVHFVRELPQNTIQAKTTYFYAQKLCARKKILKSLAKGVAIQADIRPNLCILNPPLKRFFFIPVCNFKILTTGMVISKKVAAPELP